jgi:6-phosphogluconolactonase
MTLVLVANAGDGTISSYRLSDDSLTRLAVSHVGRGCSTFVVDHDRSLVYAGTKDGPAIVTCALDRDSGELTVLRTTPTPGNPTYLSLAHGGSVLLTAYYHQGLGDARPVIDGVVPDAVGSIEAANAHCVVPSSDSRHAYFVSLGEDLVAVCAVGADATLSRTADAPAPPGCGPRHLVLDRTETHAYVVTEYSGEILHYRRDLENGTLVPATATGVVDPSYGLLHSRLGADPVVEHLIWGADLHLAADGRTVWSTERTESILTTSPIDDDGAVGSPLAHRMTEAQPRGFAVSPDGRHVVVAGERSETITLYGVGEAGALTDSGRYATGAGSNWVRFC